MVRMPPRTPGGRGLVVLYRGTGESVGGSLRRWSASAGSPGVWALPVPVRLRPLGFYPQRPYRAVPSKSTKHKGF